MTANAREVRRLLCKHYFSKENNPQQRQIVRGGFRALQFDKMKQKIDSAREHWQAGRYRMTAKTAGPNCFAFNALRTGIPNSAGHLNGYK
jgi:hypothetical protein